MRSRFFRTIAPALLLSSCISFAYANNFDQSITTLMKQSIAKYNIPGASLSIHFPNQTTKTYTVGLSSIEKKTPMTDKQLFDIGSITKLFTAAVVLNDIYQHQIKLDESLASIAKRYPKSTLSELVNQYSILNNVTIRELINHTSGLPNALNTPAYTGATAKDPNHQWTPKELVTLALKQTPNFKPGTPGKYNYTNTEYILLGYVAEAVNQKPISESMRKLFHSLGLNQTYAPFPTSPHFSKAVMNRLVNIYGAASEGVINPVIISDNIPYPNVILPGRLELKGYNITAFLRHRIYSDFPAGGLLSTSADVATWYGDLFNGKVFPSRFLKSVVNNMPQNVGFKRHRLSSIKQQKRSQAIYYSLNTAIQELPQYKFSVYYHDRQKPGYIGTNIYLPKYRISFSLLTNLENNHSEGPQEKFAADIVKLIIKNQQQPHRHSPA